MPTHPLLEKFQRAGQGQVFAFFDRLSADEQRRLLEEAAEIDLAEVAELTRTLLARDAAAGVNLSGRRRPDRPAATIRPPGKTRPAAVINPRTNAP